MDARIPTAPMKTLDGVLEKAGESSYWDGYSWTTAFAFAAAIVGSTDATAVWEAAMRFLNGWIAARTRDKSQLEPLPQWLLDMPKMDARCKL